MSLPFLLLGLYLALLVLAVALCSWAGHSAPPPEEARRVTDAAERAGLGHLAAPARLAATAALLFATASASLSVFTGLPLKWFLLAPLLSPLLVAAALFYCARKALRTAGQLVGLDGADERLILTGRSVLGFVLCCEAALGLILLSIYSLAMTELEPAQARFLTYLVGSSVALFSIVFARAATGAEFTSRVHAPDAPDGPHPASLAQLVASSFHKPLLDLVSLVVLSTFAHCALLSIDGIPEHEGQVWLYPHLLNLLGLFGLLFAGLVVRTSEEESGPQGWVRGAIVYFVLMVGGAWSLSSQLPEQWSRSVPAGLSFFYVSLGLSLWLGSGTVARGASPLGSMGRGPNMSVGAMRETRTSSASTRAFVSLPSISLFLVLLCVLVLSATLQGAPGTAATEGPLNGALPASALTSLLLAGALAVVPLPFTWLVAQALRGGSREAELLAYVSHKAAPDNSPVPPMLLALPLLALVIVLGSLGASWNVTHQVDGVHFSLFGTGLFLGAWIVASLRGHVERSCEQARSDVCRLIAAQDDELKPRVQGESAPVNFEAALMRCRDMTRDATLPWLLLSLSPAGLSLLAFFTVARPHFQSLSLGLSSGACLLSVGLVLQQALEPDDRRGALSHLAFVAALSQGLWLLAVGSFPT